MIANVPWNAMNSTCGMVEAAGAPSSPTPDKNA